MSYLDGLFYFHVTTKMDLKEIKIAVIGLGYVGLPLAIEFGKKYPTIGIDTDENRITALKNGIDKTKEVSKENLVDVNFLSYSSSIISASDCNIFVITVPTPIDSFKKPNLEPLLTASNQVGTVLKKGDIIIYESTVYPGCTEEDCVPILEKVSGLSYNVDFFCGYSPERINPGDKERTLTKIIKITSGSTPKIADFVDELYKTIIDAGTYKAPTIKIAEAAKIVENCQRDVNISFVNELALIFDKMNIDTHEVLKAAKTKWNFLDFKPGLVGGHCICVDPYYLTYKAEKVGYTPEVILSGRRVNEYMPIFVANKVVKLLVKKGFQLNNVSVLILGITFKENCSDIRNSRVVEMYKELKELGLNVDIYDHLADKEEVKNSFGITLTEKITRKYEAIVVALGHDLFRDINFYSLIKNDNTVIFDLSGRLPIDYVDGI